MVIITVTYVYTIIITNKLNVIIIIILIYHILTIMVKIMLASGSQWQPVKLTNEVVDLLQCSLDVLLHNLDGGYIWCGTLGGGGRGESP